MADCDRPFSPSRHCCCDDFRTDNSRRSVCRFISPRPVNIIETKVLYLLDTNVHRLQLHRYYNLEIEDQHQFAAALLKHRHTSMQ
ncbi:unnamed protein product [Callosobruchus maculatus]|uniref:Uncharacterized protein n=1 Tax=Callosobruchus maculatus TaxID=64391 RepID=A0A653D7N6_CALMS|nr:unnamed protein product [Callosobruchus maculatus]